MSFNKIILVGNLGRDPGLRYTPQQMAVCSFTMATNDRKKDAAGEWQNVATWFKVTLWGRQAETAAKYLAKGKPVYIEGRLSLEEWTDRDNNPRSSLSVNASDMQFIGARDDDGEGRQSTGEDFPTHTGGGPKPSTTSQPALGSQPKTIAAGVDDDIPF